MHVQDAAQRPDFPTIKQRLLQFASENFQCSADEALRLKHTKERALLDQILPPKVSAFVGSCYRSCIRAITFIAAHERP